MSDHNPIQSPAAPPPPVALTFRVTLYFSPEAIVDVDLDALAEDLRETINDEDLGQVEDCDVEFLPADPMIGSQDG